MDTNFHKKSCKEPNVMQTHPDPKFPPLHSLHPFQAAAFIRPLPHLGDATCNVGTHHDEDKQSNQHDASLKNIGPDHSFYSSLKKGWVRLKHLAH